MISLLLLSIQLVLLFGLWKIASRRAVTVFDRFFNPACFLILFYVLFFIIEQVLYPFNDFKIIGFDRISYNYSYDVFTNTQIFLIFFLLSLLAGYRIAFSSSPERNNFEAFERKNNQVESFLLFFFLVIGVAAHTYLGIKFLSIDGFRSELVKTTDGKIATAVAFYGNFAYACLMASMARRRNWILCAIITLFFGGAVLYTGSRGRFLWPLVIFIALFVASRSTMPKGRIAIAVIALISILAIMDPLKKALTNTTGDTVELSLADSLLELVEKRNFDGFGNFALISGTGRVDPSLSNVFGGARDVFMNTFFPAIYDMGVAFGSTLPGYFWAAGGFGGLVVMSFLFGMALAYLACFIRSSSNRWILASYLFGIVWFAAVGGDFIESFGKMFTAMSPGIVMILVLKLVPQRRRNAHSPHRFLQQ